MGFIWETIKGLKKKSKEARQNIYFLVLFIFVPFVIWLLFVSVKLNWENSLIFGDPAKQGLGEKVVSSLKTFYRGVGEGGLTLVNRLKESFGWEDFWYKLTGRPKIQTIYPENEINLPQGNF